MTKKEVKFRKILTQSHIDDGETGESYYEVCLTYRSKSEEFITTIREYFEKEYFQENQSSTPTPKKEEE